MKNILLLIAFSMIASFSFAQAGVSVANARLFFHSQNLKTTEKVYLTNNTKEPSTWQLSIQDWDRDSVGKKRYFPPGTLKNSCAHNLTIIPNVVTIAPGGTAEVLVSFNPDSITRNAKTSLNTMLMVHQADVNFDRGNQKENQARVIIKTQIAVHVFYVVDESPKELELVDVKHTEDSLHRITTFLQNKGLQPLDTKIRVEISNMETGEEWKLEDRSSATLPGASRQETFQLPTLKKGKYLALSIVDSGAELPIKVGEVSFTVK